MSARADASALIEEALKISKEFGATSAEARLAWEAVEEVNASDNSVATKGSLDEECEVEPVDPDCIEYSKQLDELAALLEANKPKLSSIASSMADSVNQVKLAAPDATAAENSPQLKAALEEARRITKESGLDTAEARVAWETVEEIAAAGNSNALGGSLSEDECLLEAAAEACAALEELNRVIESRKE